MDLQSILSSFFALPYIWIWLLFVLATIVQIVYYLVYFLPISIEKIENSQQAFDKPISVIIAAHNEAENLKQFLPKVLEQDYPLFEVIVVNDRSEDETETILASFKQQYPQLRTSFIKDVGKLTNGKKMALTIAIKAAKYDYLLLTDADCEPVSNQWIKLMASGFSKGDVVLGYGPYFNQKGLLNKWIQHETSFIALQYMGYAKKGNPYMGIGRNLAYKKSLFVEHKGFMTHAQLASGDDDLFINEISEKAKITYCLNADSFVYSPPKTSWKDWKRQKERHLTTFSRYRTKHLVLLSLETYSRIAFYGLLPFALALSPLVYTTILMALTRILLFVNIQIKWHQKVQESKLWFYSFVFDIISPLLYFFLYLSNQKLNRR